MIDPQIKANYEYWREVEDQQIRDEEQRKIQGRYNPYTGQGGTFSPRSATDKFFTSLMKYAPALGFSASASSSSSSTAPTNEYENRLRSLMTNPNSIADSGAYKFAFNQGQQALERSAAARGMLNSGNVLAELTRYGQGAASQQYNTEADRLAKLADSKSRENLARDQFNEEKQARNLNTLFSLYNNAPKTNVGGNWV